MIVQLDETAYEQAESEFRDSHPEYATTDACDELRSRDFSRLDAEGHAYLDYTGGGLYAESQIRRHHDLLVRNVFGNPHSHNPSSSIMTELCERARRRVMDFFRAAPEEYGVIFTSNASHALKLVGESYPFGSDSHYLMMFDNHNSVNGIREYARTRGAEISYIPLGLPNMRTPKAEFRRYIQERGSGRNDLFAYPAQSNFSGVQHPLEWIGEAQRAGWDVLLDAAAFVPTNTLDLSVHKPDFVSLSFYKMFGYPTGIGALVAKRSKLAKLHRPWFSGGTITVASVQGDRFYMAEGEAAFEDGTLNYLNLPAVEIGLDYLESIGIDTIHERCCCLTDWLLHELPKIRWPNGRPLIRIYGPCTTDHRGGTVTMNLYGPEGEVFDHLRVEEEAARDRISLRTGCFCNPGGGEVALDITKSELVGCFTQPHIVEQGSFTPQDFRMCVDGKSTGAVRVSVGLASNFRDVYRFAQFARRFVEAR